MPENNGVENRPSLTRHQDFLMPPLIEDYPQIKTA
jgi:hypothetical protein